MSEEINEQEEMMQISKEDWETIVEALETFEDEPETVDDIEDVLFQERKIYLHGDIEEETVSQVSTLLDYYNLTDDRYELKETDRLQIKLDINSSGGCLESSLAIAQAIKNSKTPVKTVCNGKAYSGAFLIFMVAKEREMGEFAGLMYHNARGGVEGTFTDMDRNLAHYKKLVDFYRQIIVDGSDITVEELKEYDEKVQDWFILKDEALNRGIVKE